MSDVPCTKCGRINTVCTDCPGFQTAYEFFPHYVGDYEQEEFEKMKKKTEEPNHAFFSMKYETTNSKIGNAFREIQQQFSMLRIPKTALDGHVVINNIKYDIHDVLLDD